MTDAVKDHERLLLRVLQNAGGELSACELHAQYDTRADEFYTGRTSTPVGRRQRRYRLSALRARNAVVAVGDGNKRRYRIGGDDR